jgi:hypothetical protein
MVSRLFGCERDEVTGGWINLKDGGFLISTKSCRADDRIQWFINTSDSGRTPSIIRVLISEPIL